MKTILTAACMFLTLAPSFAWAHGGHAGAHANRSIRDPEATSFGRPRDSKAVTRTLRVDMDDKGCRMPFEVRLRRGDTAKFVARNSGTRMHELVLGTSHEIAQHASQAERDPDLEHDEPYIVHVEPETTRELVWEFARVGIFGYGCLIHGSRDFRMSGRISVFR